MDAEGARDSKVSAAGDWRTAAQVLLGRTGTGRGAEPKGDWRRAAVAHLRKVGSGPVGHALPDHSGCVEALRREVRVLERELGRAEAEAERLERRGGGRSVAEPLPDRIRRQHDAVLRTRLLRGGGDDSSSDSSDEGSGPDVEGWRAAAVEAEERLVRRGVVLEAARRARVGDVDVVPEPMPDSGSDTHAAGRPKKRRRRSRRRTPDPPAILDVLQQWQRTERQINLGGMSVCAVAAQVAAVAAAPALAFARTDPALRSPAKAKVESGESGDDGAEWKSESLASDGGKVEVGKLELQSVKVEQEPAPAHAPAPTQPPVASAEAHEENLAGEAVEGRVQEDTAENRAARRQERARRRSDRRSRRSTRAAAVACYALVAAVAAAPDGHGQLKRRRSAKPRPKSSAKHRPAHAAASDRQQQREAGLQPEVVELQGIVGLGGIEGLLQEEAPVDNWASWDRQREGTGSTLEPEDEISLLVASGGRRK
eukprot:TRINITY_DN32998_c0_g1_i1.p1 TRINITY_DN32998_c0_g1~~TRINITY_DN32998_c0_g1_i1.p1  ORF type:complete len:483 (+),score=130.43 TRINITY_DN32998_c0_g1_i1:94-1542(+)